MYIGEIWKQGKTFWMLRSIFLSSRSWWQDLSSVLRTCCRSFSSGGCSIISGFWHGAAWTFVFWGACHGLFSVITRFCKKQIEAIPAAVNWLVTFVFVNITWVFFRAESFSDALYLLKAAAQLTGWDGVRGDIVKCFRLPEVELILSRVSLVQQYPELPVFLFYVLGLFLVLGTKNSVEKMERFRPTVWNMLVSAVLAAWCVVSFSGISTFLYFNF